MGEDFSAERMSDLFLTYLFKNKADSRHVRRIASWLGFLIVGVEEVKDKWWLSHTRQLCFEVGSKRYKARYKHDLGRGRRGGIEFVQVAKSQGQPEIRIAKQISDLSEAAAFFRRPKL